MHLWSRNECNWFHISILAWYAIVYRWRVCTHLACYFFPSSLLVRWRWGVLQRIGCLNFFRYLSAFAMRWQQQRKIWHWHGTAMNLQSTLKCTAVKKYIHYAIWILHHLIKSLAISFSAWPYHFKFFMFKLNASYIFKLIFCVNRRHTMAGRFFLQRIIVRMWFWQMHCFPLKYS